MDLASPPKRECRMCSASLIGRRSDAICCSDQCLSRLRWLKTKGTRGERLCITCGRVIKDRRVDAKHCSDLCCSRSRPKKDRRMPPREAQCEWCGDGFRYTRPKRFCSRACSVRSREARKPELVNARRERNRLRMRRWYWENREAVRQRANDRHQHNPEPGRERSRFYQMKHAKEHRRRVREWQLANPERVKEWQHLRRLRRDAAEREREAAKSRERALRRESQQVPEEWRPVLEAYRTLTYEAHYTTRRKAQQRG